MPNQQILKSIRALRYFMSRSQIWVMANSCRGEEGEWFKAKLIELADRVQTMPKTYEQDGKGDDAIVYLHYFHGAFDWYITERDMETEQLQAFGWADMGYPELGYISIQELIDNNVELDLHFEPKPLREIKK